MTFEIEKLDQNGEGIVHSDRETFAVPFSLPGEKVTISGNSHRKKLSSIATASSFRIKPICRHFGECGACQLQHFENDAYLAWKKDLLISAFSSFGIPINPHPIAPTGERRRAVFTAYCTQQGVELGFSQRRSHQLTSLTECPVLTPSIGNHLDIIKNIIEPLLSMNSQARVWVFESDNGLDIQVDRQGKTGETKRQLAISRAISSQISRLSLGDEALVENAKPYLNIGIAKVVPPPGAFVQASAIAENLMADLVCQHLKSCKKTADLYCGIGTFALRLARDSMVAGYENSAPAIASLDAGWRGTAGKLKTISSEVRDLERRPVMASELKKINGAVFDPPRSGAQVQVQQLAKSKLRKIAAVSCNPETLARDAKILLEGGFNLRSIHPIDQFRYTPHLETVALFER